MSFEWQELVGYLASALVVSSLSMSSVVKLRLFSLAGSVTFLTYGLLIDSIPIIITNVAIASLNVFFLRREFGARRDLGAVVVPPDSPFLADFLHHHLDDIRRFQPGFAQEHAGGFALVLTREGLPAGVVLGEHTDGTLDIRLDYVLKEYRDSRLGQWLYGPGTGVLRAAGVDEVTSESGSDVHAGYLHRVGFVPDPTTGTFHRHL